MQGLATGDLSLDGIVLWSRTDQLADFVSEWSTHEDFRYAQPCPRVTAHGGEDFTVKLGLKELPNNADILFEGIFVHWRPDG